MTITTMLQGFGGLVFFVGLFGWGIMAFMRCCLGGTVACLLVEMVFSIIMSVGDFIWGLGTVPNVFYFFACLIPSMIPYGITVWMIGFYMEVTGNWTGRKVSTVGKRMLLFGLIASFVILLFVFIFCTGKKSPPSRPSATEPPPLHQTSY